MAEPKWKRFERLIHQLHEQYGIVGAKVTLDDKIEGLDSKTTRQIDISIRTSVGPYAILIAIECKGAHSRRYDCSPVALRHQCHQLISALRYGETLSPVLAQFLLLHGENAIVATVKHYRLSGETLSLCQPKFINFNHLYGYVVYL